MLDLSVVIPVYNTPLAALEDCFDSINMTDDISYEVIIVDDGSQENVGVFCKHYTAKRKFFRYIYQQNQGVSAARNTGIRAANGKYIMFVDADDILLPENISPKYFITDNELIIFNFELSEGNTCIQVKPFGHGDKPQLEKKDFLFAAYQDRLNSAYARLISRRLVMEHEIHFDQTMVIAEDAKFMLDLIFAAKRIAYIDTPIYRYFHSHENGNSRVLKFPRRITENIWDYYLHKLAMIKTHSAELHFAESDIEKLNIAACELAVHNLFFTVGELILMNCQNEIPLAEIRAKANEIWEEYGTCFSLKNSVKCYVLKNKNERWIKYIAYILKVKTNLTK